MGKDGKILRNMWMTSTLLESRRRKTITALG
jgi:hypothetical protein